MTGHHFWVKYLTGDSWQFLEMLMGMNEWMMYQATVNAEYSRLSLNGHLPKTDT